MHSQIRGRATPRRMRPYKATFGSLLTILLRRRIDLGHTRDHLYFSVGLLVGGFRQFVVVLLQQLQHLGLYRDGGIDFGLLGIVAKEEAIARLKKVLPPDVVLAILVAQQEIVADHPAVALHLQPGHAGEVEVFDGFHLLFGQVDFLLFGFVYFELRLVVDLVLVQLFPFGQGHEFFQKLDVVGKAARFLNAKGLMEELPEVAVPAEVDVAPGPVGHTAMLGKLGQAQDQRFVVCQGARAYLVYPLGHLIDVRLDEFHDVGFFGLGRLGFQVGFGG